MKKILIVEDESDTMRVLFDKLKQKEVEIIEAKNGAEGLEIALKTKPDLILLDIVMPIMDGLTMLKKIKTDPAVKNIPVIILTNYGDAEKIAEAIEIGACGYLIKVDLKIDDLMEKVNEALSLNNNP